MKKGIFSRGQRNLGSRFLVDAQLYGVPLHHWCSLYRLLDQTFASRSLPFTDVTACGPPPINLNNILVLHYRNQLASMLPLNKCYQQCCEPKMRGESLHQTHFSTHPLNE